LIRLFDRADALVLASPVYFYSLPAQAKAVVDRCHPLWHDPYWRERPRRPAFFLSTCASEKPDEFQVIVREVKAFFNTLGFRYAGELLVSGMDRSDASVRLTRALRAARSLSRQLQDLHPGEKRSIHE